MQSVRALAAAVAGLLWPCPASSAGQLCLHEASSSSGEQSRAARGSCRGWGSPGTEVSCWERGRMGKERAVPQHTPCPAPVSGMQPAGLDKPHTGHLPHCWPCPAPGGTGGSQSGPGGPEPPRSCVGVGQHGAHPGGSTAPEPWALPSFLQLPPRWALPLSCSPWGLLDQHLGSGVLKCFPGLLIHYSLLF